MHAVRSSPSLRALASWPARSNSLRVTCCRERSDGLYSTITYLLSKMVEELLVILFVSLTVSLCIFYAVGFHGQWILFWLVYLVTISIGMGEAMHPNNQMAET